MTKRFIKVLGLVFAIVLFAAAIPFQAFAGEKMTSFIKDPRWEQSGTWSSTQYPKLSTYLSYQGSKAYAADFAKYMYGYDNPNAGTAFTDADEIRAGDILQFTDYDGKETWLCVQARIKNQSVSLNVIQGDYIGQIYFGSYWHRVNARQFQCYVHSKDFWYTPTDFVGYHYPNVSGATVTLSEASYTYTTSAITPDVTVELDGKTLVNGTDYSVEYSDNTNAGEATVKITGIGDYVDTIKTCFTIDPFDLANAKVLGVDESYAYTGSPIKPSVKVLRLRKLLTEGVHYTVTYSNNVEVGKANVTVTGIGNCTGSVVRTFTIKPDIADATVASIDDQTYTGSGIEPAVTVKLDGKTLVAGTDYTLSYADNVNAGTATVTIAGKGNYAGSMSREFTIAKAPQTITAKNVKKTYTAKKGKLPKAKTIQLKKAAKVSAETAVAYKKASKAGGSKIKVNAKTGKVTVKKGLKVGTYKVKVKLTAAADANHLAAKAKKITVKIVVK